MSRLSELLKSQSPSANVANPANLQRSQGKHSQLSQDSQEHKAKLQSSAEPEAMTAREHRRSRVLAMLAGSETKYAFLTDTESQSDVIVTVGIRGVATFEMTIPRDRYDPFLFIRYLEGIGHAAH